MPRTVSLISSGSAADTEHPLDDRVEPGINIFFIYNVFIVLDCFSFDVKVFETRAFFWKILSSGKIIWQHIILKFFTSVRNGT